MSKNQNNRIDTSADKAADAAVEKELSSAEKLAGELENAKNAGPSRKERREANKANRKAKKEEDQRILREFSENHPVLTRTVKGLIAAGTATAVYLIGRSNGKKSVATEETHTEVSSEENNYPQE